jgi:hypothetical protein
MNFDYPYYTSQSPITDPCEYASSLEGLPNDIGELCRIVQGTTVHIFWAERYGIKLDAARQEEVQLRTIRNRIRRTFELDSRPLTNVRALENKIVGNCRDFSVLLVSILRHQGIPARARCGFGTYFIPNHFEDHWVAEYWNAAQVRWILVDAQLDTLQSKAMKISFDPIDVPRDQFIVGGQAWKLCRSGQADPETFGIFDMHGLDFVRGNFVRDVASLNKQEMLPWDCWGIIENPALDTDDLTFLDSLADLTSGDVPDLEAVRAIYASDARIRMDGKVHTYLRDGKDAVVDLPL